MSAVVVSAAVARGRSAQERIRALSLINPFKRQRTLDENAITEETDLWPSERRVAEGHTSGGYGYGSVSEPNLQRPGKGGVRRYSNPPPLEPILDTVPSASGVAKDDAVRPTCGDNSGRDNTVTTEENDQESDDTYVLNATPYRRLVWLFSLVPLAALLTILVFVLLLHGLWTSDDWSSSLVSYLSLSVWAAATWTVSFTLRIPLYLLASFLCRFTPTFTPFLSTLIQVLSEEALRLCSLTLVHIRLQDNLRPSDAAFPRVWALAFGWATAEVVVSVWQGYEQLALYKDVLCLDSNDTTSRHRLLSAACLEEQAVWPAIDYTWSRQLFEDPDGFMNDGIEQLIRLRARIELEEVYGIPIPNIPVFVSSLQRIDSIILSLALYLLISSSYLPNLSRSSLSGGTSFEPNPHQHPNLSHALWDTIPTFFFIVALHTLLSVVCANLLPRIGIHTASYLGCIVAVGALFAGLGRWDAL